MAMVQTLNCERLLSVSWWLSKQLSCRRPKYGTALSASRPLCFEKPLPCRPATGSGQSEFSRQALSVSRRLCALDDKSQ